MCLIRKSARNDFDSVSGSGFFCLLFWGPYSISIRLHGVFVFVCVCVLLFGWLSLFPLHLTIGYELISDVFLFTVTTIYAIIYRFTDNFFGNLLMKNEAC